MRNSIVNDKVIKQADKNTDTLVVDAEVTNVEMFADGLTPMSLAQPSHQ